MPNPFNVSGAYRPVSVSTVDQFNTARGAARSGDVIIPTGDLGPLVISVSASLKPPGVTFIFPATQKFKVVANAQNANAHFIGGIMTAGAGNAEDYGWGSAADGYGADLNNSSCLSFRGMKISNSAKGVTATGASRLHFSQILLEEQGDGWDMSACSRMLFDDIYCRDTVKQFTTVIYSDGRAPQYGVSIVNPPNGGVGMDVLHPDIHQIRDTATDLIINNVDAVADSQGIINASQGANPAWWDRARITNCNLRTTYVHTLVLEGRNILATDNIIGAHPTLPQLGTPRVSIYRNPNPAGPIQVGRNQMLNGAVQLGTAPDLNFASPTVMGDAGVLAPQTPGLNFPSWLPVPQRPAYVPWTSPPLFRFGAGRAVVRAGAIQPANVTINVGEWIYATRGGLKGYDATTVYEWEWRRDNTANVRDGVLVGTGPVYQAQAGEIGTARLSTWIRASNSYGWSDWVMSNFINVAA